MNKKIAYSLIIFAVACLFFIPFLGHVHLFDWDEINFAECAREMLVSHNYSIVQINFLPFWEKPPLFIWMQAASMYIFGITEFAARFPNAICGAFTLVLLFLIGKRHFDTKFGVLWVVIYAASFLPHFYFKSGIIDPWFNFFIFLGVYLLSEFLLKKKYKHLILSALGIGLAIMTKGPVGLLILILCYVVFLIISRFKNMPSAKSFVFYALIVASVGGAWFLYLWAKGDGQVIVHFIKYQIRLLRTGDAGHGGPFYYHFVVLLIGCFPMSLIALPQFAKRAEEKDRYLMRWMKILFFVVLILFSIVKTKIIHYSSLCYFPLSFIAAYGLYQYFYKGKNISKIIHYLIVFMGYLFVLVFALIPQINKLKPYILRHHIIKDPFANAALQANVHWQWIDELPAILLFIGIFLFALLVNRKKKKAYTALFFSTFISLSVALILIVPKVEKYSQGAAIDFYQTLQGKNCYIETIDFKSYAQYFYTQKQMPKNKNSYSEDWLLKGDIDKPAYFVSKINKRNEIEKKYPQLEIIGERNGFVFYKRMPKSL